MRKLFLAGAATIGVLAAPTVLAAQETEAEASASAAADDAGDETANGALTANEANARAAPPTPTVTRRADAVVTNYPGNLNPPPASALDKTYPVCTATRTDNCQNPGEGGAPGRSRALPYWPGEPASEQD